MIQYQVIKKNFFKERYDEASLKKTELSIKEIDSVMKKFNLGEMKHSLPITAFAYRSIR